MGSVGPLCAGTYMRRVKGCELSTNLSFLHFPFLPRVALRARLRTADLRLQWHDLARLDVAKSRVRFST
jgi:hypothetical protein